MNLSEVKLEKWLPDPLTWETGKNSFVFPRVWKLSLTEDCEKEIFGNVSPYRTARLPPLPWGNEQYFDKKLAIINDSQVEIYNAKIEESYKTYKTESVTAIPTRLKPLPFIEAGVVEVFRASYNVKLTNVYN